MFISILFYYFRKPLRVNLNIYHKTHSGKPVVLMQFSSERLQANGDGFWSFYSVLLASLFRAVDFLNQVLNKRTFNRFRIIVVDIEQLEKTI